VFLATQFDATVASIGGKAIGWKNLEKFNKFNKGGEPIFKNSFLLNGTKNLGNIPTIYKKYALTKIN
jgi:hypothetical protein